MHISFNLLQEMEEELIQAPLVLCALFLPKTEGKSSGRRPLLIVLTAPWSHRPSSQKGQNMNTTINTIITENTTFSELLSILRSRPEVTAAAEVEKAEKERETQERRMHEIFGADYDDVVSAGFASADSNGKEDPLVKEKRRPGAIQLRSNVPCIAKLDLGGGSIEVFANGYCVYDNGDRKTVLWIPDCGSTTYYFGQLRDNEKLYLDQKSSVGEDVLGPAPWYNALMIAGENSIERNLEHPISEGTRSDEDDSEEWDAKSNYRWISCTHFDTPEEALLKKEQAEEIRKVVKNSLSETQKDAVEKYFFDGMGQKEAAEFLGVTQPTFSKTLSRAKSHLEKNLKNIF